MSETIAKSDLLHIRPGEFDDLPFIYSTWLKGLRWGNPYFKQIDQDSYFKGQHRIIEGVLKNPATNVSVMCTKDELGVIIGYAVSTGKTLHFVYLKQEWRGQGLAKDLVPKDFNTVSSFTRVGLSILKKYPGVIINPYL